MNYFDKRPVSFDKRISSRFNFWKKIFVEFCGQGQRIYIFKASDRSDPEFISRWITRIKT